MPLIKICGLRRMEDIEAVNIYKPDMIGFVFAENRTRQISVEDASRFRKALSKDIKAVGVFVNQDTEYIAKLLNTGIIDMAQLHGQESEADVRKIKELTGKTVIKAVSVASKEDVALWQESEADYLLFDNGAGGTGKTFDWSLIEDNRKPFFLAGGINESNVREALLCGADVIDISGGVETDGFKDAAKIHDIIEIIRKEQK